MMHLLNCKEVTTRLSVGDMSVYSWQERFVIRFHLAICWVCRHYEKQLRTIGRAYARSIHDRLGQESLSEFKKRLIHHLGNL